ncbi:MAG: arsenite efflux transporter metallochaperone ArsD [Acidobacteriota bacterium]
MTKKVEVFDPPMCCSSGVCGPAVDPVLSRFAADLQWLVDCGIKVERYNLSQQPHAFAANPVVKSALAEEGVSVLPLILVDGQPRVRTRYPTREELSQLTGLPGSEPPTLYTETVTELVAIGAAIASHCEPCFRYHFDKARQLGISLEDIARAVKTARNVKETPARSILELADRYLQSKEQEAASLLILQGNDCAAEKECCE